MTISKAEIKKLLKGFYLNPSTWQVTEKLGGIQVDAIRRTPMWEFDYQEFVFKTLEGKVPEAKIHMLDSWTFTIECE